MTTVTDRHVGLDFGDLDTALDGASFPLCNAELLGAYGDLEIEHANGAVPLRSVLATQDDQIYASPTDVRQSVLNMVDESAIGRKQYSDRETNDTGIDYEPQSF